MFRIDFTDTRGNRKTKIAQYFGQAKAIAMKERANNARSITVKRIRVDIWLVDPDGTARRICSSMTGELACRWTSQHLAYDDRTPCLLVPCEVGRAVKTIRLVG